MEKLPAGSGIVVRDASAFGELFGLYYRPMCFFAAKIVRDDQAAEDIVQEVFIRFWEKKPEFPNATALKSFLYTAVQNRALNHLEKHNNRRRIREKLELETTSGNDFFLRQVEADVAEILSDALEQLPGQCRKVFEMSVLEDRNIREVAGELHIAETTVKTQRRRAKKILQERLRLVFPLPAKK